MIYKDVTLVYTTFNRKNQFERSLRRLHKLDNIPSQIIVVDDGSKDGTREMVQDIKNKLGLPIQYFYRDKPEYDICCIPRNIALRRAKNEILITAEPEVIFVTDIIPQILESFKKFPEDVVTAGDIYFTYPNTDMREDLIWENPRELIDNVWTDGPQSEGLSTIVGHEIGWVAPFVGGYRTEWLMEIQGWDENLTGYAFDDIEILTRLRIKGHGQQRDEKLTIIHQWHDKPPPGASRQSPLNEKRFHDKKLDEGGPEGPNIVANKSNPNWGMPELKEISL